MTGKIKAKIIDDVDMKRIIVRLAHEIIERNKGTEKLVNTFPPLTALTLRLFEPK